ncbi:MAG: hypothetical protein C5B49_07715 [Bdellovibrio sp.]|nr:MAG: hypothetical protein C5B49_07715 [Bdellovibrio sp.]
MIAKFFFLILLVGCATHQSIVERPLNLIRSGQVEEALRILAPLAAEESRDQLVYLMEYGTALHIAGRYADSNKVFLTADKLTDEVDYYSVSRIAAATLTSQEVLQYKGESYEKLLINSYLALNYLMLGDSDGALVEVRRINDKIKKFRADGRKDYEQSPLASYLSALIWESDQKYDDAYIDFKRTFQIDPSNPLLPFDLLRSSKLAHRVDDYTQLKKQFPQETEEADWYDKRMGTVTLILEQGWGPRKHFSRQNASFPVLIPERSLTATAKMKVSRVGAYATSGFGTSAEAKSPGVFTANARQIYDVERVAIATLDADYKYLVARKVGSFVAKEVVAEQIRQKDELLGFIARIAMHASDRADLRQWASLPQTIQIASLRVPAGDYLVSAEGLTGYGNPGHSLDEMAPRPVKVQAGRTSFINWRALH